MFILDKLNNINCGNMVEMNSLVPELVSLAINIIKIAVPVLLIIFGMLDLGKAVMAQKEDEIKKGQQTFVKRIVAAVIVFLVAIIVQLVVGIVSPDEGENENIWDCFDCLIDYKDGDTVNPNCHAS